jgi:hypothetical protein
MKLNEFWEKTVLQKTLLPFLCRSDVPNQKRVKANQQKAREHDEAKHSGPEVGVEECVRTNHLYNPCESRETTPKIRKTRTLAFRANKQ